MLFYVSGFFLLLAAALAAYIIVTGRSGAPALPDDIARARQLLMEKFTGDAYFQVPPAQASGFPYMPVLEAKGQVAGVLRARNLPPEEGAKIDKLIDKLAESPKARLVSGDEVNVLQLNLALEVLYGEKP